MGLFKPFRSEKEKPIINQAIEERNSALNDIYNYQNQGPVLPKKKGKKSGYFR